MERELHKLLTTYQAVLHIRGQLKTVAQTLGFEPDDIQPDEKYPTATFWSIYERHRAGYGQVNKETGEINAKLEPAGIAELWPLLQRADVHTTQR